MKKINFVVNDLNYFNEVLDDYGFSAFCDVDGVYNLDLQKYKLAVSIDDDEYDNIVSVLCNEFEIGEE